MFCSHCGKEIMDDAEICIGCGCRVKEAPHYSTNGLIITAKVFMIIACIYSVFLIIPAIWVIPMTIVLFNKISAKEPISTGFKICILLFVNILSGIFLLCANDN